MRIKDLLLAYMIFHDDKESPSLAEKNDVLFVGDMI